MFCLTIYDLRFMVNHISLKEKDQRGGGTTSKLPHCVVPDLKRFVTQLWDMQRRTFRMAACLFRPVARYESSNCYFLCDNKGYYFSSSSSGPGPCESGISLPSSRGVPTTWSQASQWMWTQRRRSKPFLTAGSRELSRYLIATLAFPGPRTCLLILC
jgi:hypothetical protein